MTPASAPRILVVDDTPAKLQLLHGMLQELGHRVRPVTNIRDARKAIFTDPRDQSRIDFTKPETGEHTFWFTQPKAEVDDTIPAASRIITP
ncbi:MAG: hypothetical protein HZA31_09115 [Opitutae bacterium]|nr:hypothetical protein [Opitutae bacterium]